MAQNKVHQTTAPATVEQERPIEFIPFGATESIKLSATVVREFVAVPTKSGALPTPRDCVKFMMLCRGKRANPFEGDCYLIGYDGKDGNATFSMVCGIELFLKRAEQSADYDGRESGVIVSSSEGVTERQGSIVYKGETLEGGWAKVYRKDRSRPEYKAVKFATYNTGRSRWEKDPGGQIEKVALSQALRQAYPTALGGLYTQEEMQSVTEAGNGILAAAVPAPTGKGMAGLKAKMKAAEPAPVPEPAAPPAGEPATAQGERPEQPEPSIPTNTDGRLEDEPLPFEA